MKSVGKAIHYYMKRKLVESYLTAREMVVANGYGQEIDWQESRCLDNLSESSFLEEAAWVVLSSGMREKVISQRFPMITDSFLKWISADIIVQNANSCRKKALRAFNNVRKVDAIVAICERVAKEGFACFRVRIEKEGIQFIRTLDFMGPATSYHLAKNIGLDVVKPDRHLVRIAQAVGCRTPTVLCHLISEETGDKISVIDIVLWRYATLNQAYLKVFT